MIIPLTYQLDALGFAARWWSSLMLRMVYRASVGPVFQLAAVANRYVADRSRNVSRVGYQICKEL